MSSKNNFTIYDDIFYLNWQETKMSPSITDD